MAQRRRTRKTAFVPRVVFSMAVAGVVPAVAATGCGEDDTGDQGSGGFAGVATVAMGGFGGVAAVAMGGFGGVAAVAMGGFGGVAAVAMGGFGGMGGKGGAGGAGGAAGGGGMGSLEPPASGVDAPWCTLPADPPKRARAGRKAARRRSGRG